MPAAKIFNDTREQVNLRLLDLMDLNSRDLSYKKFLKDLEALAKFIRRETGEN